MQGSKQYLLTVSPICHRSRRDLEGYPTLEEIDASIGDGICGQCRIPIAYSPSHDPSYAAPTSNQCQERNRSRLYIMTVLLGRDSGSLPCIFVLFFAFSTQRGGTIDIRSVSENRLLDTAAHDRSRVRPGGLKCGLRIVGRPDTGRKQGKTIHSIK